MIFKHKASGILGLALALLLLGSGASNAQTPIGVQPNYNSMGPAPTADINAAGYEATPMPTPVHKRKKMPTAKNLTDELTPPGYPSYDSPTSSVTQVVH